MLLILFERILINFLKKSLFVFVETEVNKRFKLNILMGPLSVFKYALSSQVWVIFYGQKKYLALRFDSG